MEAEVAEVEGAEEAEAEEREMLARNETSSPNLRLASSGDAAAAAAASTEQERNKAGYTVCKSRAVGQRQKF